MELPQLPKVLDHARPELSIQVEAISSVIGEIASLFFSNYQETGVHTEYGFNPDWDQLLSYELTDSCILITLRFKGTIVGYCMYLIGPFKHNKEILYADLDAIWISPAFRSGFSAMRMLKLGEEKLKGRVAFIMAASTVKHPIGVLLERRGYKEMETLYQKAMNNV